MSLQHFRIYFMCALGGAFEYYDFSAFIFLAGVLSQNFLGENSSFLNYEKSFLVLSCGHIARFLGGIFFSHVGDTQGRKKSFMLTMLFMTLPAIGFVLLPPYSSIGILATILLLIFRVIQGFSIGGEGPSAITFIHEYAPANQKIIAMGILFGGIVFGASIASFLCLILQYWMGEKQFIGWGFRLVFAFGSLVGALGFYLRKNIQETKEFRSLLANKKDERIPLKTLLLSHFPVVVRTIGLICPSAICFLYYVLMSKLYLVKYYHLSSFYFFKFDFLFSFTNAVFIIFFGVLAQKFKSKNIYIFGTTALMLCVFPGEFIFRTGNSGYIFGFLMINTIFIGACVGSVFDLVARSFPVAVRNSGVAMAFNVVNGLFVGVTPFILTMALKFFHNTMAIPIYLFIFILLGFLASRFLPSHTIKTQ